MLPSPGAPPSMSVSAPRRSTPSSLNLLQAGQTLLLQGQRPAGAIVVEDGLMALSLRHLDGRRHIILLAGPGDVLVGPGVHSAPADVEALAPSTVRLHPQEAVQREPSLESGLLNQIQRQHERTLGHVFALGQRDAGQRLGWFLASLANGRRRLELALGRQDIADYLGLTIETVSREFTRLRRLGAISYDRQGTVEILRPDILFAESFPGGMT
jgi:CRP-like cAMP-binding protein